MADFVDIVIDVMYRIVFDNRVFYSPATPFHASKPPSVKLCDYVRRMVKYFSCSKEVLVLALIYLDRAVFRSRLVVSELTAHRALLTSVVLATKIHNDDSYRQTWYAGVGGISTQELNQLEFDFLTRVDFRLHVEPEQFWRYHTEMMIHAYRRGLYFPAPQPVLTSEAYEQAVIETSHGSRFVIV